MRFRHPSLVAEGDRHRADAKPVAEALDQPALAETHRVCNTTNTQVMVCTSRCDRESQLGGIQAGGVGLMRNHSLSSDALTIGVRAAMNGAGVVAASCARGRRAVSSWSSAPSLVPGAIIAPGGRGEFARRRPLDSRVRERRCLSTTA
jgi:hypothetical protein